jgi:hypothetical protein
MTIAFEKQESKNAFFYPADAKFIGKQIGLQQLGFGFYTTTSPSRHTTSNVVVSSHTLQVFTAYVIYKMVQI